MAACRTGAPFRIIWLFEAIIHLCLLACFKLFSRPDAIASFTSQQKILSSYLDQFWICVVAECGLTLQLNPLQSVSLTFGFCGVEVAFFTLGLSAIPFPRCSHCWVVIPDLSFQPPWFPGSLKLLTFTQCPVSALDRAHPDSCSPSPLCLQSCCLIFLCFFMFSYPTSLCVWLPRHL